jgi:hypothetical protein
MVLFTHITRPVAIIVALVVCTMHAMADKATKKAASTTTPSASTNTQKLLRATSPKATLDATFRTLATKQLSKSQSKQGSREQASSDTSQRKETRIVFARATSDLFVTKIEINDDEQFVEIGLYNMLGKKVQDVHRGNAPKGISEYSTSLSGIPEGVYICILQGRDFRRAEKFFISR